ncbi:MAG: sigma-70 family RNA polymerase sigma factor [Pyrinomonadaceae bacterium]
MPSLENKDITKLLVEWSDGSSEALDELMPLVYDELHRMARNYMHNQSPHHTLQATALINEAYVKLADNKEKTWQDRAHFFAVAASIMRHILVDYARSKNADKRGGQTQVISLDDVAEISNERALEIIELDDALNLLSTEDERKGRVVELRYFGGLTIEETAEVLKVSPKTVARDWRFSKTWLLQELSRR